VKTGAEKVFTVQCSSFSTGSEPTMENSRGILQKLRVYLPHRQNCIRSETRLQICQIDTTGHARDERTSIACFELSGFRKERRKE
jgi:hypothetical protein